MNIQECKPLEARDVFKINPYKNFGTGFGVFILIFAPLAFCLNVWLAGGVALVVALGVYLYFETRVIFIKCPSCGKLIDASTPWECGFKQCRNENADEFPFISECEHCHFVPKAYECHHCKNLIYLTPDSQQIHAAKCLTAPEPVKVETIVIVKDVVGNKKLVQADQLSDLRHERDAAKLKKEIEIINNIPAKHEETDMRGVIKKRMVQMYQTKMTREDIAAEMKAEIQKEFAHDEFECEKRIATVDEIMLELM